MKYYVDEIHHLNGNRYDNSIGNLKIVRREIEVDPIPQFHGGTVYDREHKLWVIGFYVVVASLAVGWFVAWSMRNWA